jgi:hypothetical protein
MSLLATLVILLMYLLIIGGTTVAQYLYFRYNRKGAVPSGSRRVLIVLDCFAGLTALIGMGMCIFGWGYRLPPSWLQGTPFADYTIPGLILGLVVGGSALVAMVTTIKSARTGAIASMIAGVIMMGWIIGEYILIPQIRFFSNLATNWQQGLFFFVGLVIAVLALRVMPGSWRGMLHTAHLA